MAIGKGDAFQHVLCMDLSKKRFRVAIISKSGKKIAQKSEWEIGQFNREHVEGLLKEEFFRFDFQDFVLSSGQERNTLVPVEIFNHTSAQAIFKLNFKEPFDNVDYARIPELGMVNVYEFPMWIKSLFVVKFPRVKIVHRSTVLLRAVFDQPTFRTKIHLFIEDEQTYVAITSKSKLIFFNRFDCKAISDVIYHALFVLEQKAVDRKEMEFNVYGKDGDWKDRPEFERLIGQKVNIDTSPELSTEFLLSKHLLCV